MKYICIGQIKNSGSLSLDIADAKIVLNTGKEKYSKL